MKENFGENISYLVRKKQDWQVQKHEQLRCNSPTDELKVNFLVNAQLVAVILVLWLIEFHAVDHLMLKVQVVLVDPKWIR